MKKMIRLYMGGLLALASSFSAAAATFPVDDSGTQVLSPMVKMQWEEPIPSRDRVPSTTIVGQFSVRLRLNTQPWAGKVGKIFITLNTPPSGPVRSNFRAQNQLLDGSVQSGQRTLVYSGIIPRLIEEPMVFDVMADGNRVVRPEQLDFSFEIDVQ